VSSAPFRVAPLEVALDRTPFNCGAVPLDAYFHHQVSQDVRRRATACFVAFSRDERIAGYYTLAPASLVLSDLPPEIGKQLPRHPSVPAVRMGRLAVDRAFKGQGLGAALLSDALARAARSPIAAFASVVEVCDEPALAFYRHHGFIALPDLPLTLFLPLVTLRRAAPA